MFKKKPVNDNIQWTEKEIDQWISLDDRKLQCDIEFPGITPMNPLEIRAKYLEDILNDIIFISNITYDQAILILIKELGKETVEFGIENHIIPTSIEEFEQFKRELA